MRKTLAMLMVMGSVAGCGGSNGGGPARDTTAPTLTVTAPTTALTGGDTVVISVAAVDNIDASVSYVLSCTGGGQLTGNSLVLPNVTADTTIQCTATATDAAGNTGTGTLSLNVKPSTARVTLSSASQAVTAGGSGLLLIENLPLTQETYDGTIGGRAIKLARASGNQLIFSAPLDLAPGTQRLRFNVGTRAYEFDVSVGAAIAVANPRGSISSLLSTSRSQLAARLGGSGLSATERTALQEAVAKIDAAIAGMGGTSDVDLARFAAGLAGNGFITATGEIGALGYRNILTGNCGDNFKLFSKPLLQASVSLAYAAGGLGVSVWLATLAPLTLPEAVGVGVIVAIAANYGSKKLGEAVTQFETIFGPCWTEDSVKLVAAGGNGGAVPGEVSVRAITVAEKQAFSNKQARSFKVQRTYRPQDAIRGEVTSLLADIKTRVAASSLVPATLRAAVAELPLEGTDTVPAANIGISSISRGDIAGSLTTVDAETVRITFTYTGQTQPTENIDFTFVLTRSGEQPATVSAQLAVKLPEADDAAAQFIQDTPGSSNVQVRNATSLEVVSQPANGTVTLAANGTYQYTPKSRFFGTDSFTYRARNDQGVSRTATVTLTVARRFEGLWNIVTESTTTAQSRPGLCPNESNSFAVTVNKISDTQYTANYAGYDITLTMSGKDDPAGPQGSRTVTYDDDPGKTTETVTVQIPDSRRLFGTSFFEYAGPNGSFCRGNTKITGSR